MLGPRSKAIQEAAELSNFDMAAYVKLAGTKGAVNLSQGCPNYPGSRAAREAAAKLMLSDDASGQQYSPTKGHTKLRESIRGYYAKAAGWKLGEEEVVVTTSASEGLYAVMQAFLNPGDEVVYFEPFFPWYAKAVHFAGAKNVAVPLTMDKAEGKGLRPDMDFLEKSLTKKTRIILWNTPHNPAGWVATLEETKRLCEICTKHDLLLVSDEVYEAHVFPSAAKAKGLRHYRPATFKGMHQRTITLGSASKLFSLTGWRIGWALGPAKLLAPLDMAHASMSFCAPTPLQLGVAEAFDQLARSATEGPDGKEDEIAKLLEDNYTDLSGAFKEAGLRPLRAEGGHFLAVDISARKKSGAEFTNDLAKAGVICLPMNWFCLGSEGKDLIRVALCKKRAGVKEAVKRIKAMDLKSVSG